MTTPDGPKCIALIPARGGSKRIPRKNIKPFGGRPMITHGIQTAIATQLFHKILVSTEDPEIARVSRKAGAETPFERPAELADDYSTTTQVIRHGIQWLANHGDPADLICCIYPTAPFLTADDIRGACDLLQQRGADFVFTAAEHRAPIFRAMKTTGQGDVEMVFPEHYNTRSQDLPATFYDAGMLYWGRTEAWLQDRPFFSKGCYPFLLPSWRVHDIDTPDDWERAERFWSFLATSGGGDPQIKPAS